MLERLRLWLGPVAYLGRNPLTLTGAVLTTSAGVTLAVFLTREMMTAHPTQPYVGILLFLILPTLFVLGLVLMPIGAFLRRRKLRKEGHLPTVFPRLDFAEPLLQRALVLVAVATVANVGILAASSYQGVEHMESVSFCGTTCHTVMQPEYTAYLGSPHSRVACVQCHIGPGASWFVRSKLDGTRQVIATALNTYSTPIPSPVHELRPARETCEQCHWPRKFHGDKLVVKTKYAEDEPNTRLVTVLLLRIGGHGGTGATGIHGRHLDAAERIRYVAADERRQEIARVSYVDDAGKDVEYLSEDVKLPAGGPAREERRMDCVDCHNRPTHAFETPQRAIDRLMEEGRISRRLPFVKKKAVELIRADYPDRDAASARITESLVAFYQKEYPEIAKTRADEVDAAAKGVRDAYLRNVFPAMKVAWGTHPNNVGHEDFPGCFRCHDDKHKAADGRVINQDCEACHQVLALEEPDPKAIAKLGLGVQ